MSLSREERLIELLRKAQNRLRNQGDVPEITLSMNLLVHDEIERELGGKTFLHDIYCPLDTAVAPDNVPNFPPRPIGSFTIVCLECKQSFDDYNVFVMHGCAVAYRESFKRNL